VSDRHYRLIFVCVLLMYCNVLYCSLATIELCMMPVSLCIASESFAYDVQCFRVVLRFCMYACDVCCRASDSVCLLVLVLVLWTMCWLVCVLAIVVDVTECLQ
jgi:hypothetical protein